MNTKKTILVIAVIFLLFAVSFSGTVLVGQLSENKQIFKVNIPSKSDDDEKTEVTKKHRKTKRKNQQKIHLHQKKPLRKVQQRKRLRRRQHQAIPTKTMQRTTYLRIILLRRIILR